MKNHTHKEKDSLNRNDCIDIDKLSKKQITLFVISTVMVFLITNEVQTIKQTSIEIICPQDENIIYIISFRYYDDRFTSTYPIILQECVYYIEGGMLQRNFLTIINKIQLDYNSPIKDSLNF